MSRWMYATEGAAGSGNALSTSTDVIAYTGIVGERNDTATEAISQVLMRNSFTARNLLVNATSVTGTNTFRDRKNGSNGGMSISISTTGVKEDTSGSTSLASGDLYNYQQVGGSMHGDTLSTKQHSVLLDDADAAKSVLAAIGFPTAHGTGESFITLAGARYSSSLEAEVQLKIHEATTASRLRFYLSANSFSASTTWRSRVNGGNGNQSVSVAASTTGMHEDASNSDSLSANDLLCVQKASGGTSGTANMANLAMSCAASAAWTGASGINGLQADAGETHFKSLAGANISSATSTTEATSQVKTRIDNTFKNIRCYVSSNGTSASSTVNLRANGGNPSGGPSISVGAGSTGAFEDTSNSYPAVTTDAVCFRIVAGSGGAIVLTNIQIQQTPPVPPFTGTAALMFAGLTTSGTATFSPGTKTATAAVTLPGLQTTGVAEVTNPTYSASAALTLAGLTTSGTGTSTEPTYTGTAAVTLAGLETTVTGTFVAPVYSGSAAVTLAGLETTATGTASDPVYSGSAAITLAGLQTSGTATFTSPVYSGTAAIVLAGLETTGTGTFTAPIYSGAAAIQLAGLQTTGTGTSTEPTYSGTAAIQLAGLTTTGTGTFTAPVFSGSAAPTLAGLQTSATATFVAPVFTGATALTFAGLQTSGTATFTSSAFSGSGAIELPPLGISGTGTFVAGAFTGTAELTFPGLTINGISSLVSNLEPAYSRRHAEDVFQPQNYVWLYPTSMGAPEFAPYIREEIVDTEDCFLRRPEEEHACLRRSDETELALRRAPECPDQFACPVSGCV